MTEETKTTKSLVTGLREAENKIYNNPYQEISYLGTMCIEAADEIERLEKDVEKWERFTW